MVKFVFTLCAFASVSAFAQAPVQKEKKEEAWQKIYRASATKQNDLVHTKLDVRFDYDQSYLYGKAWITLQPHFYATDTLHLDAKGMNINAVALTKNGKNSPLKYTYDSLQLHIQLDKSYTRNESYTIYIDYVAKPNEFKAEGSAAITDAKGLYFINPKGEDKEKPVQVWTQGETEGTSVWCPTIDRPNQKTTQEISMTVPAKYVSLSNGLLIKQQNNNNGTRTDTWKMNQPHAPYLMFMGVGDYAVVKDSYKGKEVSYYVEKAYEKVARRIFGNTPEMISFYSRILGVDYPWAKYAQMTARDYVSGAMENTTATLHTDKLQQNARELADGNQFEAYVAHELFHQWFGDLVTAESWSNLTVNESFANYSEVLWDEYKYGADKGQETNYNDLQTYLNSRSETKDLVRFHYKTQEDMFDAVSYHKGGRILNMLRHYVGDSAFFKSLNLYLTQNKFKAAEAHQLRLAFEEVTGEDLNWFWNQWYYGNGHPQLDISYAYQPDQKIAQVIISQTQTGTTFFRLPVDIDVYINNRKTRYHVWADNKADTFSFPAATAPQLINVDGDKVLLAEKEDHKTADAWLYQFQHAGNYTDRREALEYALQHPQETSLQQVAILGLKDPYYGIRSIALKGLGGKDLDNATLQLVTTIAKTDSNKPNRALAIGLLGDQQKAANESFFLQGIQDSSYSIAGASLAALAEINSAKALSLLPSLEKDAKGQLKESLEKVALLKKTDADFDSVYNKFKNGSPYDKFTESFTVIFYLTKVEDVAHFKTALNAVNGFSLQIASMAPQYREAILQEFRKLKQRKLAGKSTAANPSAIDEEVKLIDTIIR
jgi:aminopeptidase N